MLKVDERTIGPEARAELLARDDVAGTLEHHAQDLERLILQAHAGFSLSQLARAHIELEGAEAKRLGRVRRAVHRHLPRLIAEEALLCPIPRGLRSHPGFTFVSLLRH